MVSVSGVEVHFGRILVAIGIVVCIIVYFKNPLMFLRQPDEPLPPVRNDHPGLLKGGKSAPSGSSVGVPNGGAPGADPHTGKDNGIKFDKSTVHVGKHDVELLTAGPSDTAPDKVVFLMHGAIYSAQDWKPTMEHLATKGYRSIAVTLNYTAIRKSFGTDSEREGFMTHLLEEAKVTRPVLVSPSASGFYALPYLMSDPTTAGKRLRGFVALAPALFDRYKPTDYAKLGKFPFMSVTGKDDKNAQKISDAFATPEKNIETHEISGGHPCYLEHPDEWLPLLIQFLGEKVFEQEKS